MSDNVLTGAIPSSIEGARDMVSLDLSKNQISSTIPAGLMNLRLLVTLALSTNKLSGPLPHSIANLTSLVLIDVRHNGLTGTIPIQLDQMEKLGVILLDYNRMHGPLPLITPSLTSKQTISLSHNKFSGNVDVDPDYILQLNNADFRLQYVDVSYNLLSGPVSHLFGTLHTLRHFDISGNGFIGTFPSRIGWDDIEFLAAADNGLTGTVPVGHPALSKSLAYYHPSFSLSNSSFCAYHRICGSHFLHFSYFQNCSAS
jgi:Leucine-rich repeat (LRR) protein